MKACLMKVNYDPKYVSPNQQSRVNYEPLHSRLSLTKEIYGPASSERKHLRDTLEDAAKRKLKQNGSVTLDAREIARIQADAEKAHIERYKKSLDERLRDPLMLPPRLNREKENRVFVVNSEKYESHKEGVAKAHKTMRLQPLYAQNSDKAGPQPAWSKPSAYDSQQQKSVNAALKRPVIPQIQHKSRDNQAEVAVPQESDGLPHGRSKTCVPPSDYNTHLPYHMRSRVHRSASMLELERKAKIEAEKAMKNKKIFTIVGPYQSLRYALRRRGWVEKIHNAPPVTESLTQQHSPPKKKAENNDDDDEDNMKEVKIPPWAEDHGFYNMMSHTVRNCTPTLIFTVKTLNADVKNPKNGQVVNHFGKTKHITTKAGLSQNIRNVPWYYEEDPDCFYPRCYLMEDQENREDFIDDYHVTACTSFLRHFVEKYKGHFAKNEKAKGKKAEKNQDAKSSISIVSISDNITVQTQELPPTLCKGGHVSIKALEIAMEQVERFLQSKDHADIDILIDSSVLDETQWDQFLACYYHFVHDEGEISPVAEVMVKECEALLENVKDIWPQAELDGTRNIWILKPSAMSRGRGIQIFDKIGMMMGYVDSNDGKVVLQKYIERPLLVHNTKFDIRQWFVVTDWNPLTVWLYKDSYLRFCSQQYTLKDLHVSIHLSNNSVQKNYKNGARSEELPEENMWTSEEFQDHLRSQGFGEVWSEKVYPGMRNAIMCSLLCTQDSIESRKSAFELYGADFMVTEDFQPWLIEINSSPSMSRSTKVTAKLVDAVLEDTMKVVLDRKLDKNCEVGRFELVHQSDHINEYSAFDPTIMVQGKRIQPRKNMKISPTSSSTGSSNRLNGKK